MKNTTLWMLAAILFCGINLVGCGNKNAKQPETKTQTETSSQPKVEMKGKETCFAAVDHYLVNEIGKHYAEAEHCIPCTFIVITDESNPDDILVWGDFWVYNYNVVGDTLKCVSGGDHPGLMHVKKTGNGYEVTGFDAVEDGAGNLESAKRIFGDKFDAFKEINSRDDKREDFRLHTTADYVMKHNLGATMLQDYGWPAVELPK